MSVSLDEFFAHYYRRRPVTATFTGVHAYDAQLPDWSPAGLAILDAEMRLIGEKLAAEHPPAGTVAAYRDDVDALDAELARRFLEIQRAELHGMHGVRGNPSLWVGEAIFGVISLMIRDFAPIEDRMRDAAARLNAIPEFLDVAKRTLSFDCPAAWIAKARRECEGATVLLSRGIDQWIAAMSPSDSAARRARDAAAAAYSAFSQFSSWLAARLTAPDSAMACGGARYDFLLDRGHWSDRSRADLLSVAHREMVEARRRLDESSTVIAGSWPAAQEQLAAKHSAPDDYLTSFGRVWSACRACAAEHDAVTWGDWPIRYVPYPEWTAEAAPFLYYLFYRSPAPFDSFDVYDYVVPALPADRAEQHLRAWNDSVVKLNHVVHHGAVGHHVQNWHASTRAKSRVGKIAAVDCASRLAMLSAATMAEGWACYATRLMEEFGFLDALERLSEAHSRVRFLARAIVDIELHQGSMAFDDAVRFWTETVGGSADVARNEVVKASMFPCTAIIYWLGTEGIADLRAMLEQQRGDSFSLREFHDELLDHGSIPVPLVARLMSADTARRAARSHSQVELNS
jgi:hypothetical protein